MNIRLPLLEKVQIKQIAPTIVVCAMVGKDIEKGDRLKIVYKGSTLFDKPWGEVSPDHSVTVKAAVLRRIPSLEGALLFFITPEQKEGVTAIQYSYTLSL